MADQDSERVTIEVDASRSRGPLKRIWRSIGYDELNWTYTQTGKRIFDEIAALNDGPFWIRNHNIFSSGNLRSSPYEASTNCYREDADGKPIYDWTTVDRIYDVFVGAGCKPMVELDFMPHDLSSRPASDVSKWPDNNNPYKSCRWPPKDYDKWRELNRQFALHLIERYGREEVRTWYFSSWNEPDGVDWVNIFKVEGRSQEEHEASRRTEFLKIHDYAIDGILAADEKLRVGGPDIAGVADFLEMFLRHCDSGTNHATGKTGTRLDFVSFHTKGTGLKNGKLKNPDCDHIARRGLLHFHKVMRKFPKFQDLPVLCNEWDIDVWSPGGIHDHPNFRYRNTSYFPVFLIRSVKELLDVSEREKINLELITQWVFYFHGMRCFEGTRAIFDPLGIRKPVFNGFELLARLGTERLSLATDDRSRDIVPGEEAGNGRCPREEADAAKLGERKSIQPHPRVDGLAARSDRGVQVLVWNQQVDQFATGSRPVTVRFAGLGEARTVRVVEHRIDEDHSNAHTAWEKQGCPDWPTEAEVAAIRTREKLEKAQPDRILAAENGCIEIMLSLPMHAVSLLEIETEPV